MDTNSINCIRKNYIPRFRLQNKVKKKKNCHLQPIKTYFQKIQHQNSVLLRSNNKLSQIDISPQCNSNQIEEDQCPKQSPLSKNVNIKLKLHDISLQRCIRQMHQDKEDKQIISLNQTKQSLNNKITSAKQTRASTKNDQNNALQSISQSRKQLSYTDYQKIVEDHHLNVKYFQGVAEKNDQLQQNKYLTSFYINNQQNKSSANSNINPSPISLSRKQNTSKKRNHPHFKAHKRAESASDHFIVGSERGALSNQTIAQKILNQSIQRHKTAYKLLKYKKLKTESDLSSQNNDQVQTHPPKKFSKSSKINQKTRNYLSFDQISTNKYKILLDKILKVSSNECKGRSNEAKVTFAETQGYSNGKEYDQFDNNLMRKQDEVHFRSNNQTHKSEWKV